MNSVLQCLSHTDILAEYFVLDQYKVRNNTRRNRALWRSITKHFSSSLAVVSLFRLIWESVIKSTQGNSAPKVNSPNSSLKFWKPYGRARMPPSTVQSSKKLSSDTAPSFEAQRSMTLRSSFSGCSTRCTKTSTRRPSANTSRLRTTTADRMRSLRRRRSPTTWDAIILSCKRCSGRNSDRPWRVLDVTSRATLSIHSTAFQCNYLNCRYKRWTSEFCTTQSPQSKWRWL